MNAQAKSNLARLERRMQLGLDSLTELTEQIREQNGKRLKALKKRIEDATLQGMTALKE